MIRPEDITPSTPPGLPVIVPPATDVTDGEAFHRWLDEQVARAMAYAAPTPLPRVERRPEEPPPPPDGDDDDDGLAPWLRTARDIHGEPMAEGYGIVAEIGGEP